VRPAPSPATAPCSTWRRLLEATAATIAHELGFAAVIVNIYRPAWDDYEVVVAEASLRWSQLATDRTTNWRPTRFVACARKWSGSTDPPV
jgi:hypothetical protein